MKTVKFGSITYNVPSWAVFVSQDTLGNVYAYSRKPEFFKANGHYAMMGYDPFTSDRVEQIYPVGLEPQLIMVLNNDNN